jgi:Spy/CpxP family protein refolding chaperone
MRGVLKLTLVTCLALGLVGVALAQRGGMGFGGGLGFLAMNPGVQKEIKVTDEQRDKLKDAMTKVREDHKDDFAKFRDLSDEEKQKLMKTFNDETDKALGKVLDDKQMKRLRQIGLQQQGARAFQNPEVQGKLKLTNDQKEKIKTLNEEAIQKMRDLFQGGGDREENAKKFAELRKDTMEKVTGVLTDDQKKTWKEMTGEPFEVQFQPRNQN